MMKRIAVIGAGIAGLACATELADAGASVTVLEKDAAPGGRMNTRYRDGFAFDFGADFLADCYSSLGSLARHAGVQVESVGLVRHVVLRDGELHSVNFSGFGDALRFGGLSAWTKARALVLAAWVCRRYPTLDFFDLSGMPPELLVESAYDFARRLGGDEFAEYVVDPFTSTMMFYRSQDLCAGAFVSLFRMMASGRESFGIRRVVGGMQALPRALAARLGARTGQDVSEVQPLRDGVAVTVGGGVEVFDEVVVACPAPAARELLPPGGPRGELLAGTRYSCTIDVAFRIPRSTLADVHCVYVPHRESSLISEFTNEGIKGDDTVHGDRTLVNVGLHEKAARALLAVPDEGIFAQVHSELVRLSPRFAAHAAELEPHDLQRWPAAIPVYDGAHVTRVSRFLEEGQGDEGIWLCGDYLNHPWLEGAARCGVRVARDIARLEGARTPQRAAGRAA